MSGRGSPPRVAPVMREQEVLMLPSRSPLFAAVLVIGCEAPPEVDRTAARLAPPPPTLRLEVTPLEAVKVNWIPPVRENPASSSGLPERFASSTNSKSPSLHVEPSIGSSGW